MKEIKLAINGRMLNIEETLSLYVVKPLFVVFIYFGMFSRFSGLPGLTGGMTAALLSGIFFVVSCVHLFLFSKKIEISQLAGLGVVFFLCIALTPLVSSFIFNEQIGMIARYFVEVVVIFFIFLSFYYFIKSGLISPRFFIYSMAIVGALASLQLLINLIGQESVMRLRGLAGLNYIGNSLAVSSIAFIMILSTGRQKGMTKAATIFGLIVVFITMLLTGTRAATIAFVVALGLLQFFGMKSKNFKKYLLLVGLILFIPFLILALNIDLSLLFRRYTAANIERMAVQRFDIYASSVTDLSFIEFLVGRPDLYVTGTELSDSRLINPHNAFLSLIRFNGIFSFMLFVVILLIVTVSYIRLYLTHKQIPAYRLTEASILVFLAISVVNVMFSGGKITRNFYVYIALGYAVGYLDLLRSVSSPKEYLKMILKY